ncbi:nucleoside phosphorylase-I family protein [Streptomyces albidoflavus]|uniref:hypothetical protein n=1 Tax=Streptomyces albidoflavus TaxID=1886 RepID=UPI0033EDA31F
MRIGVITGSGSYDWPHLEGAVERTVVTDHGEVTVTEGRLGGAEIVQLSRHGAGHHRLSSQVDHKANLAALLAVDAEAVVSFTRCGTSTRPTPSAQRNFRDDPGHGWYRLRAWSVLADGALSGCQGYRGAAGLEFDLPSGLVDQGR